MKFRLIKCGIASDFAFGYDPTSLSTHFKNIDDRIPYFDIHYSSFDIRYSPFRVTFSIRPAVFFAGDWAEH